MHTFELLFADPAPEGNNPAARRYTTQRGTGAEALDVRYRLGDFDPRNSPISDLLRDRFPDATKAELISVAQMTILVAHARFTTLPHSFDRFDRVTRRSKDLIFKWYHDHWMIIQSIFPDIGLADEHFSPISRNSVVG
jgi:hypothetical protein